MSEEVEVYIHSGNMTSMTADSYKTLNHSKGLNSDYLFSNIIETILFYFYVLAL